ncbi:MAG: hypothetical protein ACMUHY_06000 [Thermoplasmatota archaeon]
MNTDHIIYGNVMENEIVWTKALRAVYRYGPAFPGCYIEGPSQALA